MIDFLTILNRLGEAEVDFILVGALSAAVQGAQISTVDVDIVHSLTAANRQRLAGVLAGMGARYRSHPAIEPTFERLDGPGHQLLTTDFGPLDVLGEIEDGLGYDDLLIESEPIELGGYAVHTLALRKYLELRRANPRARDYARFPIIEAALAAAGDEAGKTVNLVTVYVALTDARNDVFRPVESVALDAERARLGPATDPSENWQFPPGTVVLHECREVEGKQVRVAVAKGW